MTKKIDVIVVGAGFAGIYALHKLRQLGLSARVFEAGQDIGGTWFWNAYPGARCDVESLEYAYSFDGELVREWDWTERYAAQPEIQAYMKHVVDRLGLAPDIALNTRVESVRYDGAEWAVVAGGAEYSARYVVMASGCLSKPNVPKFAGLENFSGEMHHTGRWPKGGVDLEGKRVAVIGTGSSGVQLIAEIAPQVGSLTVFQRTPHWVVPAGNRPLGREDLADYREHAEEIRLGMEQSFLGMRVQLQEGAAIEASEEERARRYGAAWDTGGACFLGAFEDLLFNIESNATARQFIAEKIRAIVNNPETAAALTPSLDAYALGAKRLVQDDRYYERFNLENVRLVDTRKEPIERFTACGIETSDNIHEFDVIVLATGFDAVTGALLDIDIRGVDGQALGDKWAEGPLNYLGVGVAGFPNFFTITGPGSPSVLSNMVLSIEQHVDWISGLIGHMESSGLAHAEPTSEAENHWRERVAASAEGTVYPTADSWYFGANIPGKPRVFLPYLGGVGPYREECDQIASEGYPGFSFN